MISGVIRGVVRPAIRATLSTGGGVNPPLGFAFLTDADGAILTDDDGAFLMEAA